MTNYNLHVDKIFQAMSDPTRVAVLDRLSESDASVSELAKPFNMALPSFLQHLSILEKNKLVISEKLGRSRIYKIRPETFEIIDDWLIKRKSMWEQRLDRLDNYLNLMKEKKND